MGNRRFSRDRRRVASERDAFLSELMGHAGGRREKPDHKTAMLCRQVQRALSLALDGDLAACAVGQVAPAPNAGHLLVELLVPPDVPVDDAIALAAEATPRLRHAVAQSITRKRAPELSFVPVATGGAS